MMTSEELMRSYRDTRSEEAFRELVHRYLDLVYATALRRVNGDTHLAQDVAQTVFCDLALQIQTAPPIQMLGGWLHQHACFVASKMVRAETRRRTHEQQAMSITGNETNWHEIAPHLDEALAQLNPADRHAIILRFFERRDFRSLGSELGLSDDAAQKRVGRAIDKLRDLLARRGITISAAALTLALASCPTQAAPAGLDNQITNAALKASASVSALTLLFLRILAMSKIKLALGGLLALTIAMTPVLLKKGPQKSSVPSAASSQPNTQTKHLSLSAGTPLITPSRPGSTNSGPTLRLTVVDAKDGKPLQGVLVENGMEKTSATTDREGHCEVSSQLNQAFGFFELRLSMEPFADTQLRWEFRNGETVPAEYTVKMEHAIKISGKVVGPNGEPVAGAQIGFNQEPAPSLRTPHQPVRYGFTWMETKTDAEGRWEMTRVLPDMLSRIYGTARHPDYVAAPYIKVSQDKQLAQQLLDGTHVFHLGAGAEVRGVVVDAQGMAVPDASVLLGEIRSLDKRTFKTGRNGEFFLAGCSLGKNLLSADAPDYAATTLSVDLSAGSQSFRLVLNKGKALRIKIIDKNEKPIAGASVDHVSSSQDPEAVLQADFSTHTDQEGRVLWEKAPDQDLWFQVFAKGFSPKRFKIHPDAQEHIVTLSPALIISGTVIDEATQQPIPNFWFTSGWLANLSTTPTWASGSTEFSNGQFERNASGNERDMVFKIEADGYARFVSRVIKVDEGELHFDVRLRATDQKAIKVVFPNGQPVAGAKVALVTPEARFVLRGDDFLNTECHGTMLSTAEDGTINITLEEALQRIVVIHRDGFAEASASALRSEPTLVLKPWGRIEGTYKPTLSKELNPEFLVDFAGDLSEQLSFAHNSLNVTPDAAGRFVWPKLPATRLEIVKAVPSEIPYPSGVGKGKMLIHTGILLDVPPGETTNVMLPGGYIITAKIIVPQSKSVSIVNIHTPNPLAPPTNLSDLDLVRWYRQPEIQAQLLKLRHFPMSQTPQGTWVVEGVPGGLPLVLETAVLDPTSSKPKRLFEAKIPVTIPTDPPTGTLDLGDIELKPVQE